MPTHSVALAADVVCWPIGCSRMCCRWPAPITPRDARCSISSSPNCGPASRSARAAASGLSSGHWPSERDDLLAYSARLDRDLATLAAEFRTPVETVRAALNIETFEPEEPARWPREVVISRRLGSRFFPLSEAVAELARRTVRASSVIENFNSRR